ncbi:MAG TPA: response regulator transcription factor [Herpetosiphonaceae bacterium]|nr:response regulator transcription factor [Herpetosiphonaceae bacterium]
MGRSVHQLAPEQGADRGVFVPALIAVAPADLPLLAAGTFGQAQRRRLWRSRLAAIAGTVAAGLILAMMAAVGILLGNGAPAVPALLLLMLLAVGASWLWRLRHTLGQAQRIGRDLRSGKAGLIDGEVWCSFRQSIGLFHWLRYRVAVGGRMFSLPRDEFERFRPGRWYRVFFAPDSGCFLGALELPAPVPTSVAPAAPASAPPAPVPIAAAPPTDLTAQEREILRLIAAGLSNKEIAARLSLSVNTIKMYCSQIYLKLDVHRRTEAVARARELGLL